MSTVGFRCVSASPTETDVAGAPRPGERWAALDGLRAIAVYLVVAFHAGLGRFEGGFIGVDVFFVLSGFLITRLLIEEHDGHDSIDLFGFYARRARRLLPAAWLAIVGTSAMYVLVATPFERASVVRDARSAIFYVANWNFIERSEDYFGESIESSPFLHLWSLAVEEQFYLVWPLCVLAVIAVRRRSHGAAITVVGILAMVGAVYAVRVADGNLLRAYYGTDTRVYQLLVGAVIALVWTASPSRLVEAMSRRSAGLVVTIGLLGVAASAITFDLDPVDRGLVAAIATGIVIVGVVAGPTGMPSFAERILATPPMVWLGRRSYATYLWHWPFVIVLQRIFVIGPRLMFVIVTLAATAVAHLSMDLVERPVRRRSGRADRREDIFTVATAVATTALVGIVIVAAILRVDVAPLERADRPGSTEDGAVIAVAPVGTDVTNAAGSSIPAGTVAEVGAPATTTPSTAPVVSDTTEPTVGARPEPVVPESVPARTEELLSIPVPADLGAVEFEADYSAQLGCPNKVPDDIGRCVLVDGEGERVLLVGDSHAARLKVALAEHAAATGGTFAALTMNGCPWQDGLLYVDALPLEAAKQFCRDQRDALYDDLLDQFDPDVVVLAAHDQTTEGFAVEARPERSMPTDLTDLTGLSLIDAATRHTLDQLAAPGRRVVILEPLPNSPFHAVNCLSAAEFVDECSFVVGAWPHLETPTFRQLAGERPDLTTVDMTTLACPNFPTCRPIVDGIQVRTDADHLYEGWVQRIGPDLVRLIGLTD